MRSFTIIFALTLFGCATQHDALNQKGDSDQIKERKFLICDAEGSTALAAGRTYFLNGKKKESVLSYVRSSGLDQNLAQELFQRVGTGEIIHYADFAVDKLYSCAEREGLTIGKPKEKARICYARVDIPFFLYLFMKEGINKKGAIDKTVATLKNRSVYPESLITAVADGIYPSASLKESHKIMGTVFWTCLYKN